MLRDRIYIRADKGSGIRTIPLNGATTKDTTTTSNSSNKGWNTLAYLIEVLVTTNTGALWFKTFYGQNLLKFKIRKSICPWQAFQAESVCE